MSPYTSIKSVASDKVGFIANILAQQFDNLSKMHRVTCPSFILHGQRDSLIPIEHAYKLKDRCFGPCTFLAPVMMTHNRFDVYEDLIRPLEHFLIKEEILIDIDEQIEALKSVEGTAQEESIPENLNNSFL